MKKMKIAYILDEDISNGGVKNKIFSQVDEWMKNGHEVKVFSMRTRRIINKEDEQSKTRTRTNKNKISNIIKLLRHWINTIPLHLFLNDYSPDVIYCRYIKYAPFLKFILKSNGPYILEVNTDDVKEFSGKNRIIGFYNTITRSTLLSGSSAFVSVTQELKNIHNFAKFKKPTIVIGNGYACKSMNPGFEKLPRFNKPSLVFVGSPDMAWHGLDKIYAAAKILPQCDFHIIGESIEDVKANSNGTINVIPHGFLKQDEILAILHRCDVGISTIALHRKGMKEACPLKSRQYLSEGLPIIVGYQDPDIDQGLDFILNIGNSEDNVLNNIDDILEFTLKSRLIDRNKIRKLASKMFSVPTKESARLEFINHMLEQHNRKNT